MARLAELPLGVKPTALTAVVGVSLNNHIARELLEELRQLIQDREALGVSLDFPPVNMTLSFTRMIKLPLGRFRLDFIVGLLPLDQVTNLRSILRHLQRPARLYFVKSREDSFFLARSSGGNYQSFPDGSQRHLSSSQPSRNSMTSILANERSRTKKVRRSVQRSENVAIQPAHRPAGICTHHHPT